MTDANERLSFSEHVARVAANDPTLLKSDFSSYAMGEGEVATLAAALRKNNTLVSLCLPETLTDETQQRMVEDAIIASGSPNIENVALKKANGELVQNGTLWFPMVGMRSNYTIGRRLKEHCLDNIIRNDQLFSRMLSPHAGERLEQRDFKDIQRRLPAIVMAMGVVARALDRKGDEIAEYVAEKLDEIPRLAAKQGVEGIPALSAATIGAMLQLPGYGTPGGLSGTDIDPRRPRAPEPRRIS